jgi:hypothetical protein
MECAVFAPLFKKGDKLDFNNYHGISVIGIQADKHDVYPLVFQLSFNFILSLQN